MNFPVFLLFLCTFQLELLPLTLPVFSPRKAEYYSERGHFTVKLLLNYYGSVLESPQVALRLAGDERVQVRACRRDEIHRRVVELFLHKPDEFCL